MFQQILYTSRAADGITMRDVYDVIRVAHNRNSDSGLTGALLFLDGYFMQVLEGAPYAVEERYKRILADGRHHDLLLRLDRTSTELLFPTEWMALRDGAEIDPQILVDHHYVPGMPVDQFTGEQVLAFMMNCFVPSAVS